jgi:ketosteroid isomerase-like protein
MRWKLLAVLAVAGLFGADAPADDKSVQEVEKAIKALNEAFQNRDADAVKRLTTEDHVAITPYYGGPAKRTEQIDTLGDLKLTEYTSTQMKITPLTKDTVLITYALTLKGTFKGKELMSKNYASAVWVNKDGKWLEALYQETALNGK